MSDKPPNVRPSGYYWVRVMRPENAREPRVLIMRWADFLQTWRDTHGDWYNDDEVTVLSAKLEPPG